MISSPQLDLPTGESESFRLHLNFSAEGQSAIAPLPIRDTDLERPIAAAAFDALRQGKLCTYDPQPRGAMIAPIFSAAEADGCLAEGFCVSLPTEGGAPFVARYGVGVFRELARRYRAGLVRDGVIGKDAALTYRLTACLDDSAPPPRLLLGASATCLEVHPQPFDPFRACIPWDAPDPGDVPVVVERSVINDVVEEAALAPDREIAGYLLGKVCRDPVSGDVFILVTGLASGQETTRGEATSVTFTPETFARGRRVVALRDQGETLIGWYHSHPFRVCQECPLPLPPECLAKILFFSADDEDLTASTFAAPYHLALLAGVEPRLEGALGHAPVRMWGWRRGELTTRGFHVIDSSPS